MVVAIDGPDRREAIARQVLEALPDWFGSAESREAYIRGSRVQQIGRASCRERV